MLRVWCFYGDGDGDALKWYILHSLIALLGVIFSLLISTRSSLSSKQGLLRKIHNDPYIVHIYKGTRQKDKQTFYGQAGKYKDTQTQTNTKSFQCMLYFLIAGGSRISNMAFSPQFFTKRIHQKISTKHFPPKFLRRKISTTVFYQTFLTKTNFPPVYS